VEAVPLRKKKKFVILAVLAAFFLFVVLAPYLLSTGAALRFAVGALDKRLPGSLSVESWLVGWQQGILCQQVVYADDQRGILLRIPRLTSTQGLLELVLAPNNLGTLVVDSPELEIKGVALSLPGEKEKSNDRHPAGRTPFWNHLVADLEIKDGLAAIAFADPAIAAGIRNFSLSATFDSGIVSFTLAAHTLHGQGTARVTGSLNLPASGQGGLETLVADARLAVHGLQLRDLLTIAGGNGALPGGEGVLSADLQLKAVGLEGLEVSGHAELEELNLHGGCLGEDAPSFEKVRLNIDGGKWAASGWSVRALELVADTADFTGSGRYGADGLTLNGNGRVNLPILFAQFPRLLRLRETTRVKTGTLDFAVDLDIARDARRLDLKAKADAFSGLAGDLVFTWAGPVSLLVKGEKIGKDIRVHALNLEAPFLHADGRGDLHSFVLDATADLAQAFADVRQLFLLEWDGAGLLDLALKSKMDSGEDQWLNVNADLQINDFSLSRRDKLIVPTDHVSLLGSVNFPPSILDSPGEALDLKFALSSWLGETFVTMSGEKTEGRPFRSSFSTDTSLNLDRATGLLHALNFLPDTASVTGDLQIQAAGNLSRDEVEVRELIGEIGSLALVRQGCSFAEQEVRLEILQSINEDIKIVAAHNLVVADSREKYFRTGAGSNVVNFAARSLFLHNLSLTSATATFKLAELLVPDWRSPLAGLEADFAGTIDLAQLSGLLHGAAVLNGKSALAGSGQMALRAEATGQGAQEMSAELRLTDVSLVREKNEVPVSKELRLNAQLSRQSPEGDIVVRELLLESEPLQVKGTGAVSRSDNRQVIDLQGKMTPALEKVSTILRDGFGIDLQLAGGQSESFLAQYALAGGDDSSPTASLVTGLHADRLVYREISVRSLHMPVTLKNNELHLEVSGQMGEGRLTLIADADLAGEPVFVTIPANSQVLTGILLHKPLMDNLLSSLHPLFGVLVNPTGRLGLGLDSFAWPIRGEQEKEATFATVLDLRELSLESGKVLREILSLFRLEKEQIGLQDGELSCTGRNGRVTCTPLRLGVGEADMAISGSVGLDGTLDYLLEVPVTSKLAGEERIRFLQGTTIRVAVGGTVKSPVFDREKTLAAVNDLLRQAASKLQEEKEKKQSGARIDKPVPEQKG